MGWSLDDVIALLSAAFALLSNAMLPFNVELFALLTGITRLRLDDVGARTLATLALAVLYAISIAWIGDPVRISLIRTVDLGMYGHVLMIIRFGLRRSTGKTR